MSARNLAPQQEQLGKKTDTETENKKGKKKDHRDRPNRFLLAQLVAGSSPVRIT